MRTLEGFEPVFGEARGQLDSATLHHLPFLFYLRAKGSDHLLIHVTDFHGNTWYANMSTDFLEDLVIPSPSLWLPTKLVVFSNH